MNAKTSAVMSTQRGEKNILSDTKSSSGNMDSVRCNWNGAKGDQISTRSKPMSDTLSKLAQLITCMEYKPKPQTSSSIRKDCGHEFSELNDLVHHQEKELALQKLHCCQRCGQKFALLSSLQLHKCPGSSSMCQTCRGKPTRSSSCPSCGSEPSGPHRPEDPFSQDNSPYACAPCGQAFSHKQELLHHQQAGGCQPAKTLKPPLPPSPSASASLSACTVCSRTFRSSAGLACHMRFSPAHTKSSVKTTKEEHLRSRKKKKKKVLSSKLFPCRSCDKSFPKTSLLHRHRKEEHRREIKEKALRKENSEKAPRRRRKGETYPCLGCGKEFLHHLTRWAHFKHCASPRADAARCDPKGAKDLRPSQENRPRRGRPRTKNLTETKQEEEVERNEQDEDEDGEYPCTSCDQVFSSKAALHAHEEVHEEVPEGVHQPADTCRCCSVCAGGIPLSQIPEDCEKKVYHCVPCAEAFIALDTFLEHCQKHLIRENQDEFSDD
ncbi:zinc finger protein 184 [Rhinichthys klamathensis goyatoka]|uniref:zinc finger protein 184 n=1 Tax=Rhinichthys klamathensis goyatoka TaxID=3034132 RepID=UPI0024B5E4BD|nr:zinc finger protein 184 [Rhinichthys klamathensis goyatoka]